MFLDRGIDDLDEAAINALVTDSIQEGLTLEFKETLELDNEKQKREVAKDVSALANSQGGRIVYGIREKALPDGLLAAGQVVPLKDGGLGERLPDIVNSTIHPRPAFRRRHVPVEGGIVLVVEVYSSVADLHMVTGYQEHRYYRRGAKGNVPMTESEVREAYALANSTKASLEGNLRDAIEPEMVLRSSADESIIIAPWRSSSAFLDPRIFQSLGVFLMNALEGLELRGYASHLQLRADGYRLAFSDKPLQDARVYLAVLRSGVVHLSENGALRTGGNRATFWTLPAITRIVEAMRVAEVVYDRIGYSGQCRLSYVLRSPKTLLSIDPYDFAEDLPAQTITAIPQDFIFGQLGGKYGRVIKEIIDQIYQARGQAESPHFSGEGELVEASRQKLQYPGISAKL
jgi:hypothetical protein